MRRRRFMIVGLVATFLLNACAGSGSPGPIIPAKPFLPPGQLGDGGSISITIRNDTQMGGHWGGAAPIIATFDTTCFYDQPPWSYTIAPNTSISFGISVNASGSCFFTPSTGTVAIAEPNTGAEDTISFHNDYPHGVALNCGNYDPITSGTIDVQNTYEYDYGNPFVGNEYSIYPNTCSWDGSAYLEKRTRQ